MRQFFAPKTLDIPSQVTLGLQGAESTVNDDAMDGLVPLDTTSWDLAGFTPADLAYFSSDESGDEGDDEDEPENDSNLDSMTNRANDEADLSPDQPTAAQNSWLPSAPPLKRRRHDIPVRSAERQKRECHKQDLEKALADIRKVLLSKKVQFEGGPNGLQAHQAHAIQSFLTMTVKHGQLDMDASERAAESNGFAAKWGGRSLHAWTKAWVQERELPKSKRGQHGKVYTLLDDPAICTELRTYVRPNKWSMNPTKLADFSRAQLVPTAADKYLRHLVDNEMPRGLKKYMELELFPCIQLKAGKGVSLSTARRWLRKEGFQYIGFKKGLYFDGHDWPDVIKYRQDIFLPMVKDYFPHLVRYQAGDAEKEVDVSPPNYVERRIVLVAHDEMTAQAHDTVKKSWVFEDQHALRKKGVGRGLHQSDVICSTVRWLKDASQTLEYGKSYEGYWTGELFVKQASESRSFVH